MDARALIQIGIVSALVALPMTGCGGGGTTALDRETVAVKRLLALEAKVDAEANRTKEESHRVQASAVNCLGNRQVVCIEATSVVLNRIKRDLERETRQFRSIHRRLNDYSHAALRAAFRAR